VEEWRRGEDGGEEEAKGWWWRSRCCLAGECGRRIDAINAEAFGSGSPAPLPGLGENWTERESGLEGNGGDQQQVVIAAAAAALRKEGGEEE
jgi:hypothetical protein